MKMPKEHRGWDDSRSPQWRYLLEQERIGCRMANEWRTRRKPQR